MVALRAWASRTASTGQDLTEDLIEVDVPSDRVRPVPGTSYANVPLLRRQHPTPAPAPAAPALTALGQPVEAGTEMWIGERVRRPSNVPGAGPGVRLHRPGCWAISGGTGGQLSTDEARIMVARDPIASACDVCDAHQMLSAVIGSAADDTSA
ncbi:DUF6233 domain-containing protein [Streptomyces roseus]|uniref:DUF6233 domain-containing protein n=1 Tax=Streptomyces roseus TaxID=66430 RepID=UPI00131E4857|nr:DUF6233 domain-containing protein [Streptomyces roseus]